MNKPICKLIGIDGNVFNIIGLVVKTLKRAGQADKAKEFANRAMQAASYDDVLVMLSDYVEIE